MTDFPHTFPLPKRGSMSLPLIDDYQDHGTTYWRHWRVVDMLTNCFNEHGPEKALFLLQQGNLMFEASFQNVFKKPRFAESVGKEYLHDYLRDVQHWNYFLQDPNIKEDWLASEEYRHLAKFIGSLNHLISGNLIAHRIWN